MSTDSTPPPSKPPVSRSGGAVASPQGATPAPAAAPTGGAPASPTAAAGVPPAEVGAVELHHSSRQRGGSSRLWVLLPVAGLMLVPLAGLVYTATTTFGKGADASAEAASSADDDDEPTTVTGAKKRRNRKSTSGKGNRPRRDRAGTCCAKLHELGKTGPMEERGKFLSAATSCDIAPDAETALKRANNSLKTAGVEVPSECEE